ncbi:PAS domain S-box protein [Geitlerinema sp. CS-897]|nr:PAS domain S-box protein [Geitlerinema sp. CS-897]
MTDSSLESQHPNIGAMASPIEPDRLLERMTEAVWSMDVTSQTVLSLNRAGERLYGRSLEQFQQDPTLWFDAVHPDDRDRVVERWLDRRESEAVVEYRLVRPDGEERRVRSQLWKVSDRNGLRLESLTTDLTEYRQTQQQKLQFEKLAANLPGIIYKYVLHPNGSHEFSYISPGARHLYEVEPLEIQQDADAIWRLIYTEDVSEFQASIARSAQTLTTWTHEWRNYTASGQLKWISGIAQPERQENGDIVWDGILLDVTERKQAEAERDRFFTSTLDLICIISFDGYFKRLNPTWEKTLGYSLSELQSIPYIHFVHPDDRDRTRIEAERVAQGRDVVWFENRCLTKDGDCRWLAWTTTSFPDDKTFYAIARDITERKLEELERERLAVIVDTTTDYIGTADLNGNVLYLNRGGRQLMGLTAEEEIEHYHVRQFHPPEAAERLLSEAIPTALERGIWQGETTVIGSDGTEIPVSQVVIAHGVADSSQCYLSSIMRDMSAEKASEKRLRQQEQFLRTIYDNVGSLVFVLDLGEDGQFRYVGWNAMTERNSGIESAKASGKTPLEVFGEDVGSQMNQHYLDCVARGAPVTYEECIPLDGGEVWFQTTLTPLFDGRGTIERIIGTASDITDRKNAELALQASETKYRILAQQEQIVNQLARQIRLSLDLDAILETTVREVRSLLGVDRCYFLWYHEDVENAFGEPFFELVAEDKNVLLPSRIACYPRHTVEPLAAIVTQRQPFRIDDVARLDDGEIKTLLEEFGYRSLLLLPVQTERGDLGVLACSYETDSQPWDEVAIELLEAVCDRLAIAIQQGCLYQQSREAERQATAKSRELEQTLRQLQTAQAQLVQAEKMSSLGQLVAGVAHEINNPISFVFGNLVHAREYLNDLLALIELFRQTYDSTPAIEAELEAIEFDYLVDDLPKLFESMQAGAVRIREIVRSLRTFARLDESEEKDIDVRESFDSTLTILASRLRETPTHSAVEVVKRYGDLPHVYCFAGQLNQVLMNLFVNAIDALESRRTTEGGATITIATEVVEGDRVRLSVSDNGVGMTPEICDRIFDPFFTTKPVGKGTGLGLSISYQIVVDRHGGALTCQSRRGEGTTFVVEIPVSKSKNSSL